MWDSHREILSVKVRGWSQIIAATICMSRNNILQSLYDLAIELFSSRYKDQASNRYVKCMHVNSAHDNSRAISRWDLVPEQWPISVTKGVKIPTIEFFFCSFSFPVSTILTITNYHHEKCKREVSLYSRNHNEINTITEFILIYVTFLILYGLVISKLTITHL